MKILITGAAGILGRHLVEQFVEHDLALPTRKECDLGDHGQTQRMVRSVRPQVVIHAAADTNVEACEREPQRAYRTNAIGTQNLVDALADQDALLVYISSTGIYGAAQSEPYNEFDDVRPTTHYHRAKWHGELAVQQGVRRHLIVRTGWLFGAGLDHPRNFVANRLREAAGKEILFGDSTQVGNPTYAGNVAAQAKTLVEGEYGGTFNCVDYPAATRLDYVREILKSYGSAGRVEAAQPGTFQRVAPVSPNESAVNYKLQLLGIDRMEPWHQSLARYVGTLPARLDGVTASHA